MKKYYENSSEQKLYFDIITSKLSATNLFEEERNSRIRQSEEILRQLSGNISGGYTTEEVVEASVYLACESAFCPAIKQVEFPGTNLLKKARAATRIQRDMNPRHWSENTIQFLEKRLYTPEFVGIIARGIFHDYFDGFASLTAPDPIITTGSAYYIATHNTGEEKNERSQEDVISTLHIAPLSLRVRYKDIVEKLGIKL